MARQSFFWRVTRHPQRVVYDPGENRLTEAFATYGVLLLPDLLSDHAKAGGTAAVFFLAYAVFLAVCVRQLWRLHSWTRAPVVLAQLIQLLVGTSFWGGRTTVVAVVLVLVAAAALVALLHPRSLAALGSS